MKRHVLIVAGLLAASMAFAQEAPPALMVKVGEKSEPLELARVDTEARIFGYLAETRMTMTFRNPHGRVLAGDLYFPLPEGATVSGYALDIQGKLVDGVVVEKPKAREVFEKIVRQGVDPGLVEHVKGNNFKTRVFPIPAGGTRTVRVDYVTDLVGTKEGFAYHLPLKFGGKVGEFRLRVEVVQGAAEPVVREGGLANFKFDKWQRGYAAETTMKDAALVKDLIVGIPDVAKQPVLVEKGPDGQHYFCVNDLPAPPAADRPARPPMPELVTVLWDASGSRGGSDHRREIELLGKCLAHLCGGPTRRQPGFAVELVVFRDKAEPPRRFRWDSPNWQPQAGSHPLIDSLRNVAYDGGTQMAAISPPPGAARCDFYLLFTDGLSNFGTEDPADFDRPVYVFSADATANHPFLRYLALRTGGQYFNLNRLADEAVVRDVGSPPFAFLSARAAEGEMEETYPRLPQPVHGRFASVGKLTAREAKVTLSYGTGGKELSQSHFVVDKALAVEGNLLRRFWAQKKVDELSVFPKRNEQAITAVGKEYSIVTPGTSLLVLEGLEQYLEHRIAPPKSLPDMYAEYQRRMDTQEMQQKKDREAKIDKVLALWKERVAWWQTEFKYPKGFKYVAKKDEAQPANAVDRVLGLIGRAQQGAATRPAGSLFDSEAGGAARGRDSAFVMADEAPSAQDPGRGGRDTGAHVFQYERAPSAGEAGAANGKPGDEARTGQPGVLLKAWDPKTPYLDALKKAPPAERFAVYMQQRRDYGTSPAFFLDCAEFLREAGEEALALQVLSNVAELELENAALVRVLAHKLAQWDRLDLAAGLFEQALALRPEEPQSYRDLALVLARREQYARAIELLHEVVMKEWDDRFAEIEAIALMELNRLIPKARAAGLDPSKLGLDGRLIRLLDVDVRIILTWDADSTDIDLWVTEPSGEKVFYEHNRSTIGGRISRDFTEGYGPEEYCLRKAMNGVYRIEVNYYGTSAAQLLGAVTLQVDIFTNYGRANEQHRSITRRLRERQETIQVGDIEF